MRQLFGIALLTLVAAPAWAAAPALVPVQGYLADSAGAVVDGSVSMHFAIYDTAVGGSPLWEETQSVLAQDGFFTTYLGQATALTLSLFRDHGMVWLGVQVDGDSEMPRALMGSTPFAAYAEYGAGGSGGGGIVIQGNATAQHLVKIVSTDAVAETPLLEEGGRITGVVDPTGAQDAATKHYVDATAGAKALIFFKSDASTPLGRYLGLSPAYVTGTTVTCDDVVYLSAAGQPVSLASRDCTLNAQTWYYEGANCGGSPMNLYRSNDWMTNFGQRAWSADSTDGYYCYSQSYRTNDGTCTNEGGSTQRVCGASSSMSQVRARVCGAGSCILSAQ